MKKNNWNKWIDSNITDEQWIKLYEESVTDNFDISDEEFRKLQLKNLKEWEHQHEVLKEYLYALGVRQFPTDLTLDEIKENGKLLSAKTCQKKK